MTDVAIVGGGPAGASAAIAAARAGLDVVLFEQQRGDPPADDVDLEESLMPDCVGLLQALGVDAAAIGTPFAGVAMVGDAVLFGGRVPAAGLHVPRRRLDRALREAARRAGAEIVTGERVVELERWNDGFRLITPGGSAAARRLIDATGRSRWLARRLALPRPATSPPLVAWRDVMTEPHWRTGAVARFEPAADGWTWLAEISPGRIVRTILAPARKRPAAPCRRRPSPSATPHSATWHVGCRLAGPGWTIAGDAAAALDPAAGNGVDFALRSGIAAGRAAAACLAQPRLAPAVEAHYHRALGDAFSARAAELARRYRQLGVTVLEA